MLDIRVATPADAAAIAGIYAPFVLGGHVSFETQPPDADTMRQRMTVSEGFYPWLVVTHGDGAESNIVGYAFACRFRDRPAYRYIVETSIYVLGDHQRRGAGRILFDALIDTLRAQGFTQAVAVLSLPNDSAITLHESVGYRRAGVIREIGFKLGQWIDVGFWQRELNDATIPPVEPRPFREVGLVRA
ncbi:GNAT family N-acetyltransferase [Sphingomonas sp. SFZ2018-12]|uniref:GNAT family N-acetyltransferase n=1 Tax=Sphingomonas sp. SFZ2018-12 TaxID=2683197 RepID=UPI001F111F59|nr:GNAT family N-acetyltransferase [Sphingomonas sp. SFZ2018-12]MCH4893347.1 GNAT family N-acetyltransferase [Sphingomonas sp. SFZ2018-12]